MAGTNAKLANKLARRAKWVKEQQKGRTYDKMNKLEATLQNSPDAFGLMRKPERRDNENWGLDTIGQKPVLAYEAEASAVARISVLLNHYIQFTVSAAVLAGIGGAGLQPGDIVTVQNGALAGQQLTILTVTSTTFTCADVPSYTSEFNIYFKAFLGGPLSSYY